MYKVYREAPVIIGLEHLFENSIIPQLFVDSDMVLRDFTAPAEKIFFFSEKEKGRSIYELKGKIGLKCLIEHIKGVIYTERNMEKEVQTVLGNWFRLNIQPNFSPEEEIVDGVILTFFEIDRKETLFENNSQLDLL